MKRESILGRHAGQRHPILSSEPPKIPAQEPVHIQAYLFPAADPGHCYGPHLAHTSLERTLIEERPVTGSHCRAHRQWKDGAVD